MNVINKINIDLTSRGVIPRIDAVQFDENSRVAEISVYSGGIPWQIPDGVEISVSYRKPDNTSGLYDTLPNGNNACTFSGHMVRVMFAPQMLTVPGLVSVAVILYSDGAQLATFPFSVNVEPNPSAGGGVSNDYYNYQTIGALNEAIGDISDLNTIAKKNLVEAINEINSSGGGTITDEQIKEAVNEYLEQNPIEPTPIDATLTQEGQAADAKAVGDALKEIQISGESAKDVTEDYTASGLSNETDYLLTLTESGEYLIQRTAENYRFRCQVENVNGTLYHWIRTYGDDSIYGELLYIDGALVSDKEIGPSGAMLDVEIIDGARYPRLGTSPQTLTEEQRENARNNIGAIPTPASAAVGQTIVVKAVDENGKPTEWEAADMTEGSSPGGWRKVIDYTAPEQIFSPDIPHVEFTEDLEENPIEAEVIYIRVSGIITGGTAFRVIINKDNFLEVYMGAADSVHVFQGFATFSQGVVNLLAVGNANNGVVSREYSASGDKINNIRFSGPNYNAVHAQPGTRFEVWEVV